MSQLSPTGELLLDDSQEIYDMQSIFLGLECKVRPAPALYTAIEVFKNQKKRDTINLLLLCADASLEDIAEISALPLCGVTAYSRYLFRARTIFTTRMDFLEYQSELEEEADTDYALNYALKVKWAISMGKEFVCWRLNLIPTTYDSSGLYVGVMREAFFYHKEKSMGNDAVSLTEYLKSSKAVLDAIKTSTSLVGDDNEALFDIEEELGIIIESRPHPAKTMGDLIEETGIEFIANH